MKTLILDLETVPDYNLWTRPTAPEVDLTRCEKCDLSLPAPPAEMPKCVAMQRGKCRPPKAPAEPKETFPPRYAHRVICAGLLSITPADKDGTGVDMTLGAAQAPAEADEAGLLRWLAYTLGNFDEVITWGGARFDLPVLEMRSLHHGIAQPALLREARRGPMLEDLHDELAPRWRVDDKINLDTITRLIGLPGKNGVDGSMVEAMAQAGQHEAIASYCLRDVVQTAYLYLRTRLLRGWETVEAYKAKCAALRRAWEAREDFAGFKVSARVELL